MQSCWDGMPHMLHTALHAHPPPAAAAATLPPLRLPAVLGLGATGAAEATNLAPKNASAASMEGYNMEGTKKQVGGHCWWSSRHGAARSRAASIECRRAWEMQGTLGMCPCTPAHAPACPAGAPGLQGISPKRKKQLLAKLKANAAKVAVASK